MKITKLLLILLPLIAFAGDFGKPPPLPPTPRVNPYGATEAGVLIGSAKEQQRRETEEK